MNDYVGKRVQDVVEILENFGKKVQVIEYNDRKMTDFDEKIVVRICEQGDVTTLVSTDFLFRPLCEKNNKNEKE